MRQHQAQIRNRELSIDMPVSAREPDVLSQAELALGLAKDYLLSVQREDFRWCAELESNPSITAEYVFLHQILGRDLKEKREGIIRYLESTQNADGSWGIARPWDGDISTTAESYLALRILGIDPGAPVLTRAETYILRNGGLEKVRIFTRISFAMFGLMPWCAIPALPAEIILLPKLAPINIYSLSSWARGTMVPLFVIFHHQPVFALPNGRSANNDWLDHLWRDPSHKSVPYSAPWSKLLRKHGVGWKSFFSATDACLRIYERARVRSLREKALKACMQWILERQETSGDWAGIFPPMLNSIIALTTEGYGLDSEPVRKGLRALDHFAWKDSDGLRIQACVSPVWDTVLSTVGLIDAGMNPKSPALQGAMKWLVERQLLVNHGDWKVYRPQLRSGGWSFEYFNSWYPDIDDTAAAILALLKQDSGSSSREPVRRAVEWLLGMQNSDGGWAAFDVDNSKLFLNEIPFADIDALCDPSSPDVTGRVIEAFGLLLENEDLRPALRDALNESSQRAIQYLRSNQEVQGSWFGRWGVNYIYGTSNVLCGLARLRTPAEDPMITHSLQWLKHCQNGDGGWGESIASYSDRNWMGKGASTASQTAWALMGLLNYLPPTDPAIQRGVRWLTMTQTMARPTEAYEGETRVPAARGGTWEDGSYTATGFPKHFYLRYRLYPHYFPMMALGRFIQAHQA